MSEPLHPLMRDINTRFDAPHSRFNTIDKSQFEDAGLKVLVESKEAGVHMAVSHDQFRHVYFQGHPEYDGRSLLKEYKREIYRYVNGELESPPPYPDHYFQDEAAEIAENFVARIQSAGRDGEESPEFPEQELLPLVDNTWGDTGKAIFNNWLGLVYQLTNLDRSQQFMAGVERDDPLQIIGKSA